MPARHCQTPVTTKTNPFQKWAEKRLFFRVGSASDVTFAAFRSTTSQQGGTSPSLRNPPKRCGTARSAPTGCDASAGSAQLRRVPPNHERIIDLQPPAAGFPFLRSRSGGNPPDDGRCARDLLKRGCKTKACFFRKVAPSGDVFVRIGQETFC